MEKQQTAGDATIPDARIDERLFRDTRNCSLNEHKDVEDVQMKCTLKGCTLTLDICVKTEVL